MKFFLVSLWVFRNWYTFVTFQQVSKVNGIQHFPIGRIGRATYLYASGHYLIRLLYISIGGSNQLPVAYLSIYRRTYCIAQILFDIIIPKNLRLASNSTGYIISFSTERLASDLRYHYLIKYTRFFYFYKIGPPLSIFN